MILTIVILALVTLQRLGELWLSQPQHPPACSPGARASIAPAHYPLIVAVHAAWLAALWWLAPGRAGRRLLARAVRAAPARAGLGAGDARAALDDADHRPSRRAAGPPRPLPLRQSPQLLVVVGEIAVLPLVFGLWPVALIFSLLNAAVLAIRIREENRALGR